MSSPLIPAAARSKVRISRKPRQRTARICTPDASTGDFKLDKGVPDMKVPSCDLVSSNDSSSPFRNFFMGPSHSANFMASPNYDAPIVEDHGNMASNLRVSGCSKCSTGDERCIHTTSRTNERAPMSKISGGQFPTPDTTSDPHYLCDDIRSPTADELNKFASSLDEINEVDMSINYITSSDEVWSASNALVEDLADFYPDTETQISVKGLPYENPSADINLCEKKPCGSDRDVATDTSLDPESSGATSDIETDWEEGEGGRDYIFNEICKSNRGKRLTNIEVGQIRKERLLRDPQNQRLIDLLLCEFCEALNEATAEFRSCAGGQGAASQGPQHATAPKHNRGFTRAAGNKRKIGSSESNPGDEGEDEEDRTPTRFKLSTTSPDDKLPGLKFACPYHQHNPRKYGIDNTSVAVEYRSCAGPGFLSIARMKEHLYRRHRNPIRCNRCGTIFKTQENLKVHMRGVTTCEIQPETPTEGVTEEIEKKLKSRKKSSPGQTDEDRWRAVYHILFPDEEMPCPYYDHDSKVAAFVEYSRRETPRVFFRMLDSRASTNQLTQEIRNDLMDIVHECRIYIYRQYHHEAIQKTPANLDNNLRRIAATPSLAWNDSQSDNSNVEVFTQPELYSEDLIDYDPEDFESIFQDSANVTVPAIFFESVLAPETQRPCFCYGPCSCSPTLGLKSRDSRH